MPLTSGQNLSTKPSVQANVKYNRRSRSVNGCHARVRPPAESRAGAIEREYRSRLKLPATDVVSASNFSADATSMGRMKICGALMAASLAGWLLLLPPFSITPAGKNFVDTGAPLYQWETFSTLPDATQCRRHRDSLRQQLEKAAASFSEPVQSASGIKMIRKKRPSPSCANARLPPDASPAATTACAPPPPVRPPNEPRRPVCPHSWS